MTAKLGDRFITGVKCWVLEKGKSLPLLLNTVVTNAEIKVKDRDGFSAEKFLEDGKIKGFSSPREIIVTFKRNGHCRIFHGSWEKEEEADRAFFTFKTWEEKRTPEKPLNQTMAEVVKEALHHAPSRKNRDSHNRLREEKSRFFKQTRRERPEKISKEKFFGMSAKEVVKIAD
ncbi:MAG: hypothetical protein ACOZAL_03015 [Patescibacteria group bacterium]